MNPYQDIEEELIDDDDFPLLSYDQAYGSTLRTHSGDESEKGSSWLSLAREKSSLLSALIFDGNAGLRSPAESKLEIGLFGWSRAALGCSLQRLVVYRETRKTVTTSDATRHRFTTSTVKVRRNEAATVHDGEGVKDSLDATSSTNVSTFLLSPEPNSIVAAPLSGTPAEKSLSNVTISGPHTNASFPQNPDKAETALSESLIDDFQKDNSTSKPSDSSKANPSDYALPSEPLLTYKKTPNTQVLTVKVDSFFLLQRLPLSSLVEETPSDKGPSCTLLCQWLFSVFIATRNSLLYPYIVAVKYMERSPFSSTPFSSSSSTRISSSEHYYSDFCSNYVWGNAAPWTLAEKQWSTTVNETTVTTTQSVIAHVEHYTDLPLVSFLWASFPSAFQSLLFYQFPLWCSLAFTSFLSSVSRTPAPDSIAGSIALDAEKRFQMIFLLTLSCVMLLVLFFMVRLRYSKYTALVNQLLDARLSKKTSSASQT